MPLLTLGSPTQDARPWWTPTVASWRVRHHASKADAGGSFIIITVVPVRFTLFLVSGRPKSQPHPSFIWTDRPENIQSVDPATWRRRVLTTTPSACGDTLSYRGYYSLCTRPVTLLGVANAQGDGEISTSLALLQSQHTMYKESDVTAVTHTYYTPEFRSSPGPASLHTRLEIYCSRTRRSTHTIEKCTEVILIGDVPSRSLYRMHAYISVTKPARIVLDIRDATSGSKYITLWYLIASSSSVFLNVHSCGTTRYKLSFPRGTK